MKNPGPIDLENVNLNPDFYVRHIVWNDTPLAPLAEHLNRIANVKTNIELYSENIDRVSVTFQGDLTAEQVEQVAQASFPYLRHLTRTYQAPCWQSGNEGLSQLVLLALIERHNFLRK